MPLGWVWYGVGSGAGGWGAVWGWVFGPSFGCTPPCSGAVAVFCWTYKSLIWIRTYIPYRTYVRNKVGFTLRHKSLRSTQLRAARGMQPLFQLLLTNSSTPRTGKISRDGKNFPYGKNFPSREMLSVRGIAARAPDERNLIFCAPKAWIWAEIDWVSWNDCWGTRCDEPLPAYFERWWKPLPL